MNPKLPPLLMDCSGSMGLAGLKLVVAKSRACFARARPFPHGLANALLDCGDLLGCIEDAQLVLLRNDEHAVRVPAQEVAGGDPRLADADRYCTASTWTRSLPVRIQWPRELIGSPISGASATSREMPSITVPAGDAVAVRDLGQDITPDARILAAAIVEQDDGAGRDVVCSRRPCPAALPPGEQHRESAPGEAELR